MSEGLDQYFEIPELWGDRSLSLEQRHLVRYLLPLAAQLPPNTRVLDAGCGDGVVALEMAAHLPGLNLVGVDGSREGLRHLKGSKVKPVHADLIDLPFEDNAFGLTWCMDVLEHIPTPKLSSMVAELLRVTAGPLVILTPSMESDAIVVSCPACATAFNPYHHFNSFTIARWRAIVGGARRVSFFGAGKLRAAPPRGLRGAFLAERLQAPARITQCPACTHVFTPEPEPFPAPVGPVSDEAARQRSAFSTTIEELGVVVWPERGAHISTVDPRPLDRPTNAAPAQGLRFIAEDIESAAVRVESSNAMDFASNASIVDGAAPFDGRGVVLASGSRGLAASPNTQGRRWSAPAGQAATLQLALDPSSPLGTLDLELSLVMDEPGEVELWIFDKSQSDAPNTKGAYRHHATVRSDAGQYARIRIACLITDNLVTPNGIMVQLIGRGVPATSNTNNASQEPRVFSAIIEELTDLAIAPITRAFVSGVATIDRSRLSLSNQPVTGRRIFVEWADKPPRRLQMVGPGAAVDLWQICEPTPSGSLEVPASLAREALDAGVFTPPSKQPKRLRPAPTKPINESPQPEPQPEPQPKPEPKPEPKPQPNNQSSNTQDDADDNSASQHSEPQKQDQTETTTHG